MTLKEAAANSLLMFVAATCVVLITKAVTPAPQAIGPAGTAPASGGLPGAGEPTPAMADGVKVYYLHGRFRCTTCRSIQEYAEEAVRTGFADELQSGRIEWHAINYDEPGFRHYATDYEVAAPSVVLARFQDGNQVAWKNLPEIWEHVGNKTVFIDYIQTNLREFANGPSPTLRIGKHD
jgi:hypothetical protein